MKKGDIINVPEYGDILIYLGEGDKRKIKFEVVSSGFMGKGEIDQTNYVDLLEAFPYNNKLNKKLYPNYVVYKHQLVPEEVREKLEEK